MSWIRFLIGIVEAGQSLTEGVQSRFSAAGKVEFAKDGADVIPDGCLADEESVGDGLVAKSAGNKAEDVDFAWREGRGSLRARHSSGQFLQHLASDAGRERR